MKYQNVQITQKKQKTGKWRIKKEGTNKRNSGITNSKHTKNSKYTWFKHTY